MIDVIEDQRNEFKIKITEDFEKAVIAFLNTDGGNIYIGIDDKGNVKENIGNLDALQRMIKDRIKMNIMPSTIGLYDILIKEKDEKKYIQIVIAKGQERPYYFRGLGMTPEGCFIRIGSSTENMSSEKILDLFSKRLRCSLRNIESPNQDLEFKTLKIYYQEAGYEMNDNFLNKLDLYTNDNKYNYVAYLLADNNNISIQFAKYDKDDVYNLIENKNLGFCSLIKATERILNKLDIENRVYTKIETPTRKEVKMYDFNAIKELVTNAIAHNDWSNGYSPKFEMFESKLVISSNGGIQEGTTQDEFLKGFSNPRNPELMRVFRDLNFVEQLGTGIQRVLKSYPKEIYEFFPNHIRVSIPFNDRIFERDVSLEKNYNNLNKTQKEILKIISRNSSVTQEEIANILGLDRRTIIRNFKFLIDNLYIKRDGANKKGYWKILK